MTDDLKALVERLQTSRQTAVKMGVFQPEQHVLQFIGSDDAEKIFSALESASAETDLLPGLREAYEIMQSIGRPISAEFIEDRIHALREFRSAGKSCGN